MRNCAAGTLFSVQFISSLLPLWVHAAGSNASFGTGSETLALETQTTSRCISQSDADIPRRTVFDADVTQPDEKFIPTNVTFISNKDFVKTATKRDPTYRITDPGTYVLQEDIVLDMGEPDGLDVPFHFGFVMGIAISGDNIRLNLNGKTIRMSDRFFRHARFFNIIELAQVPYPRDAGFMEDIIPARNVIIENGTIGLTSHGGIHGNDNERVLIRDVTIKQFEVAGIGLNNVRNLVIDRVTIDNGGVHVPVHSNFAVMYMLNRTLTRMSRDSFFSDAVRAQVNTYLADPDLLDILHNPGSDRLRITENEGGKPEGSMFGIYISSQFNIGLMESRVVSRYSQNIDIRNVVIQNIEAGPYEVVGMHVGGKRIFDTFGNNFRWDYLFDNTGMRLPQTTARNRLKYKLMRMLIWSTRTNDPFLLTQNLTDTILDDAHLTSAHEANIFPAGGLDIRDGHSPKGTFGMRLEGLENLRLFNCTISNIINSDVRGAALANNKGFYDQVPVVWNGRKGSTKIYKGNYAFGISIGSSANVDVEQSRIAHVRSENGNSMAMAFIGPTRSVSVSQVRMTNTTVNSTTYDNTPPTLPNVKTKAMVVYKDEDAFDIQFHRVTAQVIHSSPKSTCAGNATDSELCPGSQGWSTKDTVCENQIPDGLADPLAPSNYALETKKTIFIAAAIIGSSLAIFSLSALAFLFLRSRGNRPVRELGLTLAEELEHDSVESNSSLAPAEAGVSTMTFRGGRPFGRHNPSRASLHARKSNNKQKDTEHLAVPSEEESRGAKTDEPPGRTSWNFRVREP